MRALRDISLGRKLMLIIMMTSCTALLTTSLAVLVYDLVSFRHAMSADLATQADVLGNNSTGALTFGDAKAATEVLAALRAEPHVTGACLYTTEGKPFATYSRQGEKFVAPPPRSDGSYFAPNRLGQFRRIRLENETVGTIYIESDLQEALQRLTRYIVIVLLALSGSALIAYALASHLQKFISRPVLELVETARTISADRNYALRANRLGADEFGVLVDEFNGMLTQIQARDAELQRQSASLEDEVQARGAVNAQLSLAKDAAEGANRAKSEFLANMSHEIRTPLNGIVGMTELLSATKLNPEQQEYIAAVQQSAESLLTVIGDILDFSKIEARKLDFDLIEFGIRETAEDALKAVALAAHRKELELACDISSDVPARLIGDPGRLRQVIINLVGNAIKFTEKGEVVIRVRCSEINGDVAHLQISVSDTGMGIPADKQKLIFEAFTQADTSTRRKFGGTGLGLAISVALVRKMGGSIWLESEVGKGSTFHFDPYFEVAAPGTQRPLPQSPVDLSAVRALVVDDNATNRRILQSMLIGWQMTPHCVAGGRAAIEALREAKNQKNPFGLVLTDGRMPDIDGFELALRIKNDPQLATTAILMLTSDKQQGDGERCRALGMTAYLIKPVRQSELFAAISTCLAPNNPRNLIDRPVATSPSTGRIFQILLAEDNPVNQKFAVKTLEKFGHNVAIANNGREVLSALEQHSFDLVLMDIQMPEMDGFEATSEIRRKEAESGGHLPIIAMTAHAMAGDREMCLAAGMDGYISKPIRVQELRDTIEKSMKGNSNERSMEGNSNAARLDASSLLDIVDGDREFLKDLAAIFFENYPKIMSSIRQAIDQKDAKLLTSAAHQLKGAVGIFQAEKASQLAGQLEEIGRAENAGDCASVVKALEQELNLITSKILVATGKSENGPAISLAAKSVGSGQ